MWFPTLSDQPLLAHVPGTGKIEVMNGAHTGKRLALNKPLTTIGKPGSAVVAITYAGGRLHRRPYRWRNWTHY
jgi:hypothetical protein